MEEAIGQYVLYRLLLGQVEPDREIYLAITNIAFDEIFSEPIGELVIDQLPLKLLVVTAMDTAAPIREIVKQIVLQYAALRPSHGDIRLDAVLDEAHDRYALVQVGWDRGRRVRGLLLYITLADDKVSIEYDGMEHGIVVDLVQRGVAEDQIVLTYRSEAVV